MQARIYSTYSTKLDKPKNPESRFLFWIEDKKYVDRTQLKKKKEKVYKVLIPKYLNRAAPGSFQKV